MVLFEQILKIVGQHRVRTVTACSSVRPPARDHHSDENFPRPHRIPASRSRRTPKRKSKIDATVGRRASFASNTSGILRRRNVGHACFTGVGGRRGGAFSRFQFVNRGAPTKKGARKKLKKKSKKKKKNNKNKNKKEEEDKNHGGHATTAVADPISRQSHRTHGRAGWRTIRERAHTPSLRENIAKNPRRDGGTGGVSRRLNGRETRIETRRARPIWRCRVTRFELRPSNNARVFVRSFHNLTVMFVTRIGPEATPDRLNYGRFSTDRR